MKTKSIAMGLACFAPLAFAACSGSGGADEATSSSSDAISTSDIMARANAYIASDVLYCQAPAGQYYDGDEACYPGTPCPNPSPAKPWHNYRTDCSGFVSYVWQIPSDPDTATYSNDQGGSQGWTTISIDSLKAGDAVVAEGHIKLFDSFASDSSALIYEEYDCNQIAHKQVQYFSRSGEQIWFDHDSRAYHAIRRNGLGGSSSSGGGGSSSSSGGSAGCSLGGKTWAMNTCTENLQCDNGHWVDRYNDSADCRTGILSGGACLSDSGGVLAQNTCTGSLQCDDGQWVDRFDDPTACKSAGTTTTSTSCALGGKTWAMNTCTENLQCDNGHWVDRYDDAADCRTGILGGGACLNDSGGELAQNSCIGSLQCDDGQWVDRFDDPTACR